MVPGNGMDYRMFPGLDNIPFRTQGQTVPHYREKDPDHKRPVVVTDMHSDVFDLDDEEQKARLEEILTMCAAGTAYESSRKEVYDENKGKFLVMIIWGQFFLEDPKEAAHVRRQF